MRPPIRADFLRSLAECGQLLDVVVQFPDERIKLSGKRPRLPLLGWSKPGKALVVVTGVSPSRGSEELEQLDGEAAKTWETWVDDGREADGKRTIRLPPGEGEWSKLGPALTIGYRSDKFGGKVRDYEHKFGRGVEAFRYSAERFGMILIKGGNLRLTANGIVG